MKTCSNTYADMHKEDSNALKSLKPKTVAKEQRPSELFTIYSSLFIGNIDRCITTVYVNNR